MPEVEPQRFPSREGGANQQGQGDLPDVCSGRRRGCALVNTPSPCSNKAIFHIQELRNKMQNWCQQSGKCHPPISYDKHYSKSVRFHPSDTRSNISTDLYIKGIGLSIQESDQVSPLQKEMTDVLVEVVYLIERLEADRQDTEEALQKEERRKRVLENQLDSISLWKQQEHSLAVQKEYEACIRDITELKWHLKCEEKKLEEERERLLPLEVVNQRLQEDISFVKSNSPLIKEKLQLDSDTMIQIITAQTKADATHTRTQNDLKSLEDELKNLELEKTSMNLELENIKTQQENRLKESEHLKEHSEILCGQIKEAEQLAALKQEQCTSMLNHILEREELKTTVNDRILELQIEIEEEVQTIKTLKQQLTKLQDDIQETKRDGSVMVSHLEDILLSKRKALTALSVENQDHELDVEHYKKRMSDSVIAVKGMHEDKKGMLQKISENKTQWERAREQLAPLMSHLRDTKARLREQEQLTAKKEHRARKTTEKIEKVLTAEMKSLVLLKSQCMMIAEQTKEEQRNAEMTNQKLQQDYEEALSATKDLEKDVEGLRKIYNDKSQKIKILTMELKEIRCKHSDTADRLEIEKQLKLDQLNSVKEAHAATVKRHDGALSRISDLTKMCIEYRNASDEMEKIAATMPVVIEELQKDLNVAEFKNQSAAHIINSLQSDINNCRQRAQQSTKTHAAHFATRQRTLEEIKEELKRALKENAELAKEYTAIQKTLLVVKQEAACVLDEKNRAEELYNYRTQLSLWQKRMHKAMLGYFKQRNLYSQAELDRCQALSQETNQKIKTFQEELSDAIQRLSGFLQSLTDDSATPEGATEHNRAGAGAFGLSH